MAVTQTAAVELLSSVSRLVRSTRTYAHLRNQELGRAGLSLGILTRLHVGPMRPGDLAVLLGVSPSAVSRAVAGLVDEGHLERRPDPSDARACSLALTAAGEAELADLHHEQARAMARVLAGWDDTKATQLARLLDEFGEALATAVLPRRAGPAADQRALPVATATEQTATALTTTARNTDPTATAHTTTAHTTTNEKAFA